MPTSTFSGSGAPADATFVTATASSDLSAERVLTAGTNTTIDVGTAGQIKVNAAGSSPTIGDTQVAFGDGANTIGGRPTAKLLKSVAGGTYTAPLAAIVGPALRLGGDDTAGKGALLTLESDSNDAAQPRIFALSSQGTLASPAASGDNDSLFDLVTYGFDGTQFGSAVDLAVRVDGTPSNNSGHVPGKLLFRTDTGAGLATALTLNADQSAVFTGAVTVPITDTQVVFSDGGTLAGDSGLTFNKTTNVLRVGGTADPVMGGGSPYPQAATLFGINAADYAETWQIATSDGYAGVGFSGLFLAGVGDVYPGSGDPTVLGQAEAMGSSWWQMEDTTVPNSLDTGWVLSGNSGYIWMANSAGDLGLGEVASTFSGAPTPISAANLKIFGATGNAVLKGDFTLSDGKALKTDTTPAHTALIQAYDVDGTAYKTFATLTNGNTPTFVITPPAGGTVSVKGTLATAENATTALTAGVLAALTNASLVITDGTGQVYRVPCII